MKSETYKLESVSNIGTITQAMTRVLNSNVKDKNQKIGVMICNLEEIRSKRQNSAIHVLFKEISDATASTGTGERVPMLKIKAMLKAKFLGFDEYQVGDKTLYDLRSTRKLSKKCCKEFIENVLEWCKSHNLDIQLKTKDYDFIWE